MAEPDVVIEFSDEELDSSIEQGGTPPVDNPGNGNDPQTPPADNKGGSFGVDDTEDMISKGQKGTSNAGDNGGNDGGADIANKPGASNAELAAMHGVTEDEIALAKNMGWTPKERFRGDPKDWKDPKEFIRITEESAPVLRERLRALSKEMNSFKTAIPTLLKMQTAQYKDKVAQLQQEKQDLEKQLEEAHYLADSKKASDLTKRIIENELKQEITKQEIKNVENGDALKGVPGGEKVVVPSGIDTAREETWRKEMWPKLTLSQRQTFKEAADFLALPVNGDQTTDQRIAYMEERLFGRSNAPAPQQRTSTPSFAPVARPSNTTMSNADGSDDNDEFAGWNSMSQEERKLAIEIIEDTPWFQKRKTDAASAKQWAEYKRSFKKGDE